MDRIRKVDTVITDAEVKGLEVAIEFALKDEDGDEMVSVVNVRLGKWDDKKKKLVESEEAEEAGIARLEKEFGVTLDTVHELVGNEKEMYEDLETGRLYVEEPEWILESARLEALFEECSKIEVALSGKPTTGNVKDIVATKNGIFVFIDVTGKNMKGETIYSRFNYKQGNKVSSTAKRKAQTKFKSLFMVNKINNETVSGFAGAEVDVVFGDYNNHGYATISDVELSTDLGE